MIACAIVDGRVKCWGHFYDGVEDIEGLTGGVVRLVPIYQGACGLLASGAVKCFAYVDHEGQLGNGTDSHGPVTQAVDVVGIDAGATALGGGTTMTACAVQHGIEKCWGSNNYGQAGFGEPAYRFSPVPVLALGGVSQVAAGHEVSCALLDGTVLCWGEHQPLGGPWVGLSTPVRLEAVTAPVDQISLTYASLCMITGGAVQCLGGNDYGQLGWRNHHRSHHTNHDGWNGRQRRGHRPGPARYHLSRAIWSAVLHGEK